MTTTVMHSARSQVFGRGSTKGRWGTVIAVAMLLLLLIGFWLWAAGVLATTPLFPKAEGRRRGRGVSEGVSPQLVPLAPALAGNPRQDVWRLLLAAPPRPGCSGGWGGAGLHQHPCSPPPQSFDLVVSQRTFAFEREWNVIPRQVALGQRGRNDEEEGVKWKFVCFLKESKTHLLRLLWKLFPKNFW